MTRAFERARLARHQVVAGVVTFAAQPVVAARGLDQHRKIMPDTPRQRDFGDLDTEQHGDAAPTVQALLGGRLAAHTEIDDQCQRRAAGNRLVAVKAADIQNAEAAHFDEAGEQRRATSGNAAGGVAPEFDRIVGDQLVAARDQFQAEFAFARAADAAQPDA